MGKFRNTVSTMNSQNCTMSFQVSVYKHSVVNTYAFLCELVLETWNLEKAVLPMSESGHERADTDEGLYSRLRVTSGLFGS